MSAIKTYRSLAHMICEDTTENVLRYLSSNKTISDLNTLDSKEKVTPLFAAVGRGEFSIVQALLEHKDLDVNKRDEYGRTSVEVVKFELRYHIDLPSNVFDISRSKEKVLTDYIKILVELEIHNATEF
jgi:ankyrin repeat protein